MATLGEYLGAGSGTTKLLLHLNGNSTDSSGNGNNGTDTAITYSQANGKFGQGAGFNGSTSAIQTPYTGMSAGTVSVFFKSSLVNNENVFFCVNQNSNNSDNYFEFIVKKGGEILIFGGGALSFSQSTAAGVITANTWYNITITQTGSLMTIYVNGKSVSSNSNSIWFNSVTGANQYCIGALKRGTQIYSQTSGSIDEVIVENRARTAQEVAKNYTYKKGRFGII